MTTRTSKWLSTFTNIYRCEEPLHTPRICAAIAHALQEVVEERVTEVLPVLQTIFLIDPLPPVQEPQEAIEKFVAARQRAGQPITVSSW